MSTPNNNRNSLSQLYEKSLKKVTGVYIQTKQNSLKLLSTLNINIANKFNEIEEKSNNNNNLESYNKENKYVDSRTTTFLNSPSYKIENFISDAPPSYYNLMSQKEYYNDDDDDISNINSINSPISTSSSAYSMRNCAYGKFPLHSPFTRTRKNPYNINEKDFSDQESSDDQDDYFSRKMSNYSSQSSSSSVSTNNGVNEFALTPLTSDEGYEIIEEETNQNDTRREKSKEKNLKRRKSTMKSNTSLKSDKSFKSNKSISKLSLKLSKNKSSSSSTTTGTIGTINFEEFISSLDISEDVEGRLQWLFRFYDSDDDGFITRGEMLQIMHTLYS